ncbi:TBC1 domain member 31 [Chamberlinius hualienensis]
MSSTIRNLLKISLESNGSPDLQFMLVKFFAGSSRFILIINDVDLYEGDLTTKTVKKIHSLSNKCTAILIVEDDGANPYCVFSLVTGLIMKYDIDLKKEIGRHEGLGQPAAYLSKHPWSDRMLATLDYSVIIWDISKPLPLQRLNTYNNFQLQRGFFGPNGDNIFTCFADGTIFSWDFPSLKFQYHLDCASSSKLKSSAISFDGKSMLTVNESGQFALWNLTDVSTRQVFHVSQMTESVLQIELTTIMNVTNDLKVPIAIVLSTSGNMFYIDLRNFELIYKYKQFQGEVVKFEVAEYSDVLHKHPLSLILKDGSVSIVDIRKLRAILSDREVKLDVDKTDENTKKPVKLQNEAKKSTKKAIPLSEFVKTLETFGEFPSKYRSVIWRHILRLPLNKQTFTTLLNRGLHPAYTNLEDRFPIEDEQLMKLFKKILSAFANWCPLFAEVSYFPIMIFPFVRSLHQNMLVCFEVIMTYLVNWCCDWFKIYPAVPLPSLAKVETYLEKHCPQLLAHFIKFNVSMRVYAWPLLESSFSDIFTADEWSRVWDHIFTSQNIDLLYAVVAAYSIVSQNSLLRCQSISEFQRYFHEKNPVPIESVLDEANRICSTISAINKRQFTPLTNVTYPVFTDFPLAVIENHAQHMKKIREMEENYIKQKKEAARLEAEFGHFHEMEAEWRRQEAMLIAVEDLRKQETLIEERKLLEQRDRLQMQTKVLLENKLKYMESKKLALQREYLLKRKDDILRLQDNARWMAVLRTTEKDDAQLQDDIASYQMQMNKCLYEIKLLEDEINNKSKNSMKPTEVSENVENQVAENSEQSSEVSSSISKDESMEEELKRLEANNKAVEQEIENLLQQMAKI